MKRIEAVIFDWAGTTVDHGSLAPVRAILRLFERHAIQVTDAQARADMGIYKKDHIRSLLNMPTVASQWRAGTGADPVEADVEHLFEEFLPLQTHVLREHSTLIADTANVVGDLRSRGLRIGATTGYTRPMLDILETSAQAQGYRPDLSYCPDDVGAGRPLPRMCLRLALDFEVSAVDRVVKIGDTPSDIHEARNAGLWAVGVAATGNELGLSEAEFSALAPSERDRLLAGARANLTAAGAHFVIDHLTQLDGVLKEIADH